MNSVQDTQIENQKPILSSFSSNFQPINGQLNAAPFFPQQHFQGNKSEYEVKFFNKQYYN